MSKRLLAALWLAFCLFLSQSITGATASIEPPVLLGVYTQGTLQAGVSEIQSLDDWLAMGTNSGVSIAGTFMDLEWPNPGDIVPTELDAAWNLGYVPFVNLMLGSIDDPRVKDWVVKPEGYPKNRSAAFVAADPEIEAALRAWARAYATWSDGGRKRAFLAPLHEMNGDWVFYGLDPAGFKAAYARIQRIFREEGVADQAVSWVFSPNGWSNDSLGHPRFEAYYPGNAVVDVVAFSAFNYGTCVWDFARWDTFNLGIKPYLDRMRNMAPSKPIFLAQTGTVDLGGDKNQWLQETFSQLAAYPALRGVLYFHIEKNEGLPCDPVDWRFYAPQDGVEFAGVRQALLAPQAGFGKMDALAPGWGGLVFEVPTSTHSFVDVEPAQPFAGVEDVWYFDWVEALAAAGLTSGCGSDPMSGGVLYCPQKQVTRAEMAVFILRAMHGENYNPPLASGPALFHDIAGHWAEGWIRALSAQGIAAGYLDGGFHPDQALTRAEAAVLLLKSQYGSSFSPPQADGGAFTDISGHWAERWVEQLKEGGIVSGVPDGRYYPDRGLSRAELPVYLLRTFDLAHP